MNDKHSQGTADCIRNTLNFQFQISWQLLDLHLSGLEDEEYLWRPAAKGLHVFKGAGGWLADWPESETHDIGPPSIAWLTWHITYWWTMVLDYSFGHGTLTRADVGCLGNIHETRERIARLRDEWEAAVAELSDEAFLSSNRTKWPFADRPFHELAAWLNLELMKNAAEIGYCRFLYATRNGRR